MNTIKRTALSAALAMSFIVSTASADESSRSDKLLLTSGVSQVEGAAGGGLTPWAVIGGQGARDQIGAQVFVTRVNVDDYHLDEAGVLLGINDRFEISIAQQRFDTEKVGAALGLGQGYTFTQNTVGIKLRVAGDAVYDSDRFMPQIAIGLQYKNNNRDDVLESIGARSDHGVDFYVSATKLLLSDGVLLNGTLRFTKANQLGLLGFGGDIEDDYRPQFEASVAYLLNRKLAVGAEYRSKPNNLGIAKEDDWFDVFVVYAPNKNVSITLAYVDLGNIVIRDKQRGMYASLQAGF